MPIYDYVCRNCGHVLEVIHQVDASGPAGCPVCGGEMRKAVSAPAVVFKGSGWAKKDARSSARTAAGSAKSDDTESVKSGAEAKPAVAADGSPKPAATGESSSKPAAPSSEAS